MKYVVYFTWLDDGFEDSCIVEGAELRNLFIKNMKKDGNMSVICWSKIYASGEYGKRHYELGGVVGE